MNHKIEVLAVKISGEIVLVEGINDHYTPIAGLSIYKSDLNNIALDSLYDSRLAFDNGDRFVLREEEAKDLLMKVGNLEICFAMPKLTF